MAEITYNIKNGNEGGIIIVLINTGYHNISSCGSLKIEDAKQNLIWEHVFEEPYFQAWQTMTIKIPYSTFSNIGTAGLNALTITASHPWPGDTDAIITLDIPVYDSINSLHNLMSGAWIQFTLNL